MNNETTADSYGTSALVLGIWNVILAVMGLPLNLFIVVITIAYKPLRSVPVNLLVMCLAFFHACCLVNQSMYLIWALNYSDVLCKVMGFCSYFCGTMELLIVPIIGFLTLKTVSRNRQLKPLFTHGKVIMIIGVILLIAVVYYIPFWIQDRFGRENGGACGVMNDLSRMETIYFIAGLSGMAGCSNSMTFHFNRKLHSWMEKMSEKMMVTSETRETIHNTRKLMTMVKLFVLLPLIFTGPPTILEMAARFTNEPLVGIPVTRLLMGLFAVPSLLNPLVTIRFSKTYRTALRTVAQRNRFSERLLRFIYRDPTTSVRPFNMTKSQAPTAMVPKSSVGAWTVNGPRL